MQIRRPLLLTAIDLAGAAGLARIGRELGGTENLTVNALCDPGGNDLVARTDAEIREDVSGLFEQAQFWAQDFAVWVVAGEVLAPGVREILRQRVLPVAHDQILAQRPLFLIVLAGDTSIGEAASREVLADLVADVEQRGMTSNVQAYLLRTHGAAGFSIGSPRSLVDYIGLAAEAIVLSNDRQGDPNLLLKLVQPPAVSVSERRKSGDAPLFGRMAVVRVRPVVGVATRVWATIALQRFAREVVESRHRIPTGWTPNPIRIHPPSLSGSGGQVISAATRQGPVLRFPERPSLRQDPGAEFERIARGCDEWQRGLERWSREVRLGFDTTVREHRDGAARERERVRGEIATNLVRLWADPSTPAPHLYAREALRIQQRQWLDEAARLDDPGRPLRQASESEIRTGLQTHLKGLALELRRRPNVRLMAIFALATLVLGSLLLQGMIGAIDPSRLTGALDPDRGLKLLLWRAGATIALGVGIGLPIMWAVLRARTRWFRAYRRLRDFTLDAEKRATQDVVHELELVDTHWGAKTIYASAAFAERCSRRLSDLLRTLHSVAGRSAPELRPASTLERLVPEGAQVQSKLDDLADALIATALDPARTVLRSPAAAQAWIAGEARAWPRDRETDVRRAMEMDLHGSDARDELDEVLGDLDDAVRRVEADWPRISANLLARPTIGSTPVPLVDVVFVGGFRDVDPAAIRFGARIDIPEDAGEQILAVRAQTGLDLTEATA